MSQERVVEYENMLDPPIQDQPEFQDFLRTLKTNIEYLNSRTTAVAITIGTVTTGSPSAATLTGTFPNYVLNLTLEQGVAGADGADGADGATGATGPAGANATPAGISGDVQINDGVGGFGAVTGTGGTWNVDQAGGGTLSFTFSNGVLTSVT